MPTGIYPRGYRGNSNGWKGGRRVTQAGYIMLYIPEHPRASHGYVFEHILIAERILERALKQFEEIHHYKTKDDNTSFVICPNRAYHMFLHQKQRAYNACGHANWRKCRFCKKYDDPANLQIYGKQVCHSNCHKIYRQQLGSKNES